MRGYFHLRVNEEFLHGHRRMQSDSQDEGAAKDRNIRKGRKTYEAQRSSTNQSRLSVDTIL